jgi:hypothetical protein
MAAETEIKEKIATNEISLQKNAEHLEPLEAELAEKMVTKNSTSYMNFY